jgi:poly(3-hydroxybutyrate) depolymerase
MKRILMPTAVLFCAVAQTILCFAADPPETAKDRDTLIYARTDPPGAKVFVNGKELGTTPGLFPADAGVATIILQLEGHGQVKKEIRIPANGITRIEIELKPQTPPTTEVSPAPASQTERRVHLPDADDAQKGDAVILDLASGELLKVPRNANGGLEQPSAFTALGKGDLFYDDAFGCLRGGMAKLWDGAQFVDFPAGNTKTRGDATGYKLPTVPCRVFVTTAERRRFDVTIISAANKTGADLEYRELGPHESLSANSSPQTPSDPEAAAKAKSQYNLKYLALAMHNYMNAGKCFPHAVSFGQPGQLGHPSLYDTGGRTLPSFGPTPPKPSKLPHSWRVELLPFLDQQSLYDQYHFDEPWDGPNNRKLLSKMPAVYRAPTQADDSTSSSYFLLVGKGTIFENQEAASLAHISDGLSTTILIVEAKRDIPWTAPEDISYDPDKPLPQLFGLFKNGGHVAFADGSVRFVPTDIAEKTLRSLITRAGGESIDSHTSPAVGDAQPAYKAFLQELDEALLRELVIKFARAVTRGEDFPTKNIGPTFQIANNIREASRAKAAGANIHNVQLVRIRGNKAIVATQFANINDHKYTAKNPFCVVYEFDKQGANWVLVDIDLDDKGRLADKLQRLDNQAIPAKTESPSAKSVAVTQLTNDSLLDESQRVFRDWTELSFARHFDASALQSLSAAEKAEKEQQWLKELSTLQFRATIPAINGLLALRSKKAIPGLLKIATDRNEGDCRHRWMAIRALGLLGDPVAIPALFDLVYFPNQNTHFWAQISLVRLTGQNFGRDAAAWKQWWRKQGGQPPASDETIAWTKDPKYLDPKWQIEQDREFIEVLKQRLAPAQTAGAERPATIPTIVSTTPPVGAVDVDPATTEIRVTFSEPMAGGFSWTGGGPDYPPVANRPHWTADRKTCILPVKLEAAHYYRVGINSKSFQNFRSAAGVPARPSAIYFTTKGASDEAKAKLEKPKIVSMSPPNGAKDVDPAITELRVTFNVPMAGGFSWTGSGPHHPEVTGRPHWTDDRKTCILPVKLKPNWDYWLGINSPSHKNFQSASGIPFEPVRYQFSTRGLAQEKDSPQAAKRASLPDTRGSDQALAVKLELQDGRVVQGKLGKVAGLGVPPQGTADNCGGPIPSIIMLDDQLRRTFFSDRLVRKVRQEKAPPLAEEFTLRQPDVARTGEALAVVGQPLAFGPFDEHGRRTVTLPTPKGPIDVIQAITQLTPQWTKVEGVKHVWDMRIATSSIPSDALRRILFNQIDPKTVEHHFKVARFLLECQRFDEARRILDGLPAKFPDQPELKDQLAPWIVKIAQLSAQQLHDDLDVRSRAGQHDFVSKAMKSLSADDVGGEALQQIRGLRQLYETRTAQCNEVVKQLRVLAERLKDTVSRESLKPLLDEIEAGINLNTIDRMAAFVQRANDSQTPDADKLALALSGWLLGEKAPTDKLPLAISAYRVRGLIGKYLAETSSRERERICRSIEQESAGDMAIVAILLAAMQPPAALPKPVADKPGYYRIDATGPIDGQPMTYWVQLPPEYDPHRRYPTIVTLHGETTDPQKQIEWWAGAWLDGARTGVATRYGYIVIAPAWTDARQTHYGFSAREHAAVLNTLRNASSRFAIDTDRVYLSGHSIGGDAAWDIGLAHPNLWAGVIPIVAQADRYCAFYWENARSLPFYVVAGEKDGSRLVNSAKNNLDRWLSRDYSATVVEYRGRGHEDFREEIPRLFDWMKRLHRDSFPRKFACKTMRPGDNFFWWVEFEGLPPRSAVDPGDWPPPAGIRAASVKGEIIGANGLRVEAPGSGVTVWISPEMLDLKQRATITVNGHPLDGGDRTINPQLNTLLEDVRTRGDRQHPFWARLSGSTRGTVMAEHEGSAAFDDAIVHTVATLPVATDPSVPQIVSMKPANGAKDVDPKTTELRVTFDMPMAGGFSWTGSGPNHPEGTGRPHWTDDHKTCILPVKLKPNWDYHLGINSPSHKNFQSASGIPFEPLMYRFSTRAASPEANGTPQAAVRISLPNPRNAASFVLDLAGQRLVALPQFTDGKYLDPSKLTKSDKGDMFCYKREFACLRGGTAKQWDDAGKRFVLLPPRKNHSHGTSTQYPLPSVPGRLLITTAEKKHFDVSVLSLTKDGTLNLEYRPADPELVKKSSVPPADRREAFLPNVHDSTKGVAVILDLATGQMLSDPRDDKGYKQFDNGGKGDLALDEGLTCLRGARAEKWDGRQVGDLLIRTAGDSGMTFREYKLPDLPCRLLITTAENKRFDVTVFFYADDNDGAYLEYKELPPVSAATTSPRPVRYGNLIAALVAANATAKGLELLQTATQVDEPQSTGQTASKPSDAFTAELIPTAAKASAPRIVSISPAVGADSVDPATSEIVVTFSQAMSEGFSWTGGGPDYPPSPEGKGPFWRNVRTCVLPVKLEAGRYYRVGINSKSYQNFRSAAGVPVRPTVVYFVTKGATDEVKSRLQKPKVVSMSPANNAKNVDPGTDKLRITFNVPMGGGFSWTGGGPNHPKTTGRPTWTEDRKTCILPVELQPNWNYQLGLNSPSHNNFQSESGIPLEPVRYRFSTGRAAKSETPDSP